MSTNPVTMDSLVDLMRQTGKAHGEAFEHTNGEDADWPIWYADFLLEPINSLLAMDFTRSQLIHCLMDVENERLASAPDADWPQYYAEHFYERYASTETPQQDTLALYMTPWCPFCMYVREAIDHLGLDIEDRDIAANAEHRQALVDARQRATVPVLRITSPDGTDRWLPESRDIVHYLERLNER